MSHFCMISLGAIESLTQDDRREQRDLIVKLQKHGNNTWLAKPRNKSVLLKGLKSDPKG